MKRIIYYFIILSVVLLLLVSCSRNKDSVLEVRIAYFPNITHIQALVGISNGKFEEALKSYSDDIKVSYKNFNAGPAEIESFFAGELDIGYIGPIPAINGFSKSGGDIKIIAGASNAGAVLVARGGSNIKTVSELSGKKVAIPQFGNTQHLALLKILADNNLKAAEKGGTVSVVQAENPDIKTLMDKGDIDAAFVPEPWGTRLINEIGAEIILDYDQILLDGKSPSTALIIVSTEFMKKNPDLVEKFLEAHIELTQYIIENQDEAAVIANEQIERITGSKLKEEDLLSACKKLIVTYDPSVKSIQSFIEIYISEGYVDEVRNRDNIFDSSILNKVLKNKNLDEVK
jgi:NitT/TauT family transport system substrate-binding protein